MRVKRSHEVEVHRASSSQELSLAFCAVILGGGLFLAPLPFGGVVAWAHTTLHLTAFALLLVCVTRAGEGQLPRLTVFAAASFAGVGLLGLLQSLQWPVGVVRFLSSGHLRVGVEQLGSAVSSVPLSLAPPMSRSIALTWLSVVAIFVVSAEVGARSRYRRWLLAALTAGAVFEVLYGLRHWMSRATTIWGVEAGNAGDRLRGTFVNPDHFALYLEMVLAAILALLWWLWRRRSVYPRVEQRLIVLGPPVALWLLLFSALAFTGSRAGLIAAVVSVVVQGLLIAARDRHWRVGTAAVLAPAVGLCLVAAVGLQAGLGRWLGTSQQDVVAAKRLAVYAASLELWTEYPLLGTGMASFRDAFPAVQPTDIPGDWWHVHNDLLEVLVTTGAVGAVLTLLGLAVVLVCLARVVRNGKRSEHAAAGLAASGACAAVLVHSCFDFGLTMPANAVVLAVLCGAALGARTAR